VSRGLSCTRHIIHIIGDESLQAITCTGTDDKKKQQQKIKNLNDNKLPTYIHMNIILTNKRFIHTLNIRSVERGIRPIAALYLLRLWPFGVTWRHRSRDHWTRNIWFPKSDSL